LTTISPKSDNDQRPLLAWWQHLNGAEGALFRAFRSCGPNIISKPKARENGLYVREMAEFKTHDTLPWKFPVSAVLALTT